MSLYQCAKGTQDLVGADYDRIAFLRATAEDLFRANGGIPLDTPVFEYTGVLLGKYGDEADSKLIYQLADQGGGDLSLRYDLTIPFVRYVKENRIKKMRRYSIAKVYRRDQPNIRQGRLREFIQADFDILGGRQEGMMAEAVCLNIVMNFMRTLALPYTILVNDVRNLQYLLRERVGVDPALCRRLFPVIDKLDKQSFDALIPEFMTALPSLDIERLRAALAETEPVCPETIADWALLRSLLPTTELVFTNRLARGLDYYTGFIWEVTTPSCPSSISAGGRYDNLLETPTVGLSIGISRIASVAFPTPTEPKLDLLVTSVGVVSAVDRFRVVRELQALGEWSSVTCDLSTDARKLGKVLSEAAGRFVAIVAETEWNARRAVTIKDLETRTEREIILAT